MNKRIQKAKLKPNEKEKEENCTKRQQQQKIERNLEKNTTIIVSQAKGKSFGQILPGIIKLIYLMTLFQMFRYILYMRNLSLIIELYYIILVRKIPSIVIHKFISLFMREQLKEIPPNIIFLNYKLNI